MQRAAPLAEAPPAEQPAAAPPPPAEPSPPTPPTPEAAAAVRGMRVLAVEPDGLTIAFWGPHSGGPARPTVAQLSAVAGAAFATEGDTDYAASGEAMFRFGDEEYVSWLVGGPCDGLIAVGPDGGWRGSVLFPQRGMATRPAGGGAPEARRGVLITALSVPPGARRRAVAFALARALMTRMLPLFPEYLAAAHFDLGGGGERVVRNALSRGGVAAPGAGARGAAAPLVPGPGPHAIWAAASSKSRIWMAITDARTALKYDRIPGGRLGAAAAAAALATPLRLLIECAPPGAGGPALALVDEPHAPEPDPRPGGACADLRCRHTRRAYSTQAAGGSGPHVAGCYRATFEAEPGAPWVEVWYLLLGLGRRGLPDTKVGHIQFVVRGPGAADRHASAAMRAAAHALAAAHGTVATLAHDGGGAVPAACLLRAGFMPASRSTFAIFFGSAGPGGTPPVDPTGPVELELT
ncbi:hypothetical protein Rsub_09212 [Raphidocelis subcapitata]|uniref:N-acetyltransferase domain-containing protein n=1 Tax=Raphidocelis subcapitata TaxID=307507 RepID=A0A2V0PET6_9CHLO|nr:hypothetical protein Rsub_09212 [Raphidocelis subcapitata]|eukprot:GBF96413.1 hypothetical protein Rsub_09212 [Raphidocelis subcapitata]